MLVSGELRANSFFEIMDTEPKDRFLPFKSSFSLSNMPPNSNILPGRKRAESGLRRGAGFRCQINRHCFQ